MFALLLFLATITAGNSHQKLATLSPCDFPVPNEQFEGPNCANRQLEKSVDFLCDFDALLSRTGTELLIRAYELHKAAFRQRPLAVVVLDEFKRPLKADRLHCLTDEKLFDLETLEEVENLLENGTEFLRVFAEVLERRWFKDYWKPRCADNSFVFMVLESKSPFVWICSGWSSSSSSRGDWEASLERQAVANLSGGLETALVLKGILLGLGARASRKSRHQASRHLPSHLETIPPWAWQTLAACVLLVMLAAFLEWYVVRRKGIRAHLAKMGSDSAAKGKSTHMIF